MHSKKSADLLVFAVACVVGIAGFLSTHAGVPWIYSPFALLTTGPALLLSDAVESADAMSALACLPIVAAFLISWHVRTPNDS